MDRTTITLPFDLKRAAVERARELDVSLAELIRQCLERELESGRRAPSVDPLFAFDAVWDGDTPPDLSRRHDHYLYDDDLDG